MEKWVNLLRLSPIYAHCDELGLKSQTQYKSLIVFLPSWLHFQTHILIRGQTISNDCSCSPTSIDVYTLHVFFICIHKYTGIVYTVKDKSANTVLWEVGDQSYNHDDWLYIFTPFVSDMSITVLPFLCSSFFPYHPLFFTDFSLTKSQCKEQPLMHFGHSRRKSSVFVFIHSIREGHKVLDSITRAWI